MIRKGVTAGVDRNGREVKDGDIVLIANRKTGRKLRGMIYTNERAMASAAILENGSEIFICDLVREGWEFEKIFELNNDTVSMNKSMTEFAKIYNRMVSIEIM